MEEIMLRCRSACLSVCLSVSMVTGKFVYEFSRNYSSWEWHERSASEAHRITRMVF